MMDKKKMAEQFANELTKAILNNMPQLGVTEIDANYRAIVVVSLARASNQIENLYIEHMDAAAEPDVLGTQFEARRAREELETAWSKVESEIDDLTDALSGIEIPSLTTSIEDVCAWLDEKPSMVDGDDLLAARDECAKAVSALLKALD
jgi:hypothetical protein